MVRLNMFPIISSVDAPNRFNMYVKYIGNLLLSKAIGFAQGVDRQYIKFAKFCVWIFCSDKASLFRNHISHVGFAIAKEEMLRVNASPIVASVANERLVWNIPKVDLPGDAGRDRVSIAIVAPAPHRKSPISVGINDAHPFPAMVRFVNFFKKSFHDRSWLFSMSHAVYIGHSTMLVNAIMGDT